jgi:hypothetical protein
MTDHKLPDSLLIGAMKCGTSTLQAQLAAQPGIFMTSPKEPNFFSDDPVYGRGLAWYSSLYDAAAPDDLKGEASTHYTKLPTYPDTVTRMAEVLEAPKLIYMIRNPVERAVSHYLHAWSEGEVGRDTDAAFAAHPEFIDYGRYPMQLAPFLEKFGRESVLLTSLEALRHDPEAQLDRIAVHLGCGPLTWKSDLAAQNVSAERIRPLPFYWLLVQNPVATALRHALVPKSVRTFIKKMRQRDDRPSLPPSQRATMEAVFAHDAKELADLFPDFDALALTYPFAAASLAVSNDAVRRLRRARHRSCDS